MSNTARPRRRTAGAFVVPRSAWPTALAMAAAPSGNHTDVQQAIAATSAELDRKLAGAESRSQPRWVAVDADECDDVLMHLGIPADAHGDLRAFCKAHPLGRLVLAWADYQPARRRYTILGG